jgi:hypothetical protein
MKNLKLLIPLLLLLLMGLLPMPVYADGENWLTDYNYRKQFTITGSTDGIQTDYQIPITISRTVGVDASSTAYVGTKCESDYDDIRFTTSDGSTLLDYWIESATTTTATIWVEFDSIAASPTATNFFLYYGNSAAVAYSSGDDTFQFFDDFPGVALDATKWEGDTGSASVAAGEMTITGDDEKILSIQGGVNKEWNGNARFRTRTKLVTAGTQGGYVGFRKEDWSLRAIINKNSDGNEQTVTYDGVGEEVKVQALDEANYHTYDIAWMSGTSTKFYIDSGLVQTHTVRKPNGDMQIYIGVFKPASSATQVADWVFVGNYTNNEPTITAWGGYTPPATSDVLWYEPNTMIIGTTLPDRQGATQNGTITWGANSDITITYGEPENSSSTPTGFIPGGGAHTPFSPGDSPLPATWFGGCGGASNLPFYDSFYEVSTQTGQSVCDIYFLAMIGTAFGAFLILAMTTRSALLGVVGLNVVLFAGSTTGIVPMWIPFSILIVQIGIMYLYRQVAY